MGRAVIIGAGIAGLTAALRLRQAGWRVLLVERAPARRAGGYAVTFAGLGYDASERMGILPALAEHAVAATDMHYFRSDGRRRFSLPRETVRAMQKARSLLLFRGDIEAVLYEAVRGHTEMRFGTTLEGVEQDEHGVRAALSDGATVEADLLIGADGLHSRTRALAFGEEPRFRHDLGYMIGVSPLGGLPSAVPPDATSSVTAPGRSMALINAGGGRDYSFFGYRTDHVERDLADGAEVSISRAFHGLGWAVPEILDGLGQADSIYFDAVSQVRLDRWRSGRVVLLGDAAWCVTLFAGYGSALAVGGAEQLGTALGRTNDVPAAIDAWERDVRDVVQRKQRLGRRLRGLYAPGSSLRLQVNDLPLRVAAFPPVTRFLQRRVQLEG